MNFPKKWPSKSQWRQFFKVLTKREKIIFSVFLFLAISSFSFLLVNFYLSHTEVKPALGGEYSEGLVGQPRFLNPIYGVSRDIDRDLIEILFSGLMKYTPEGTITLDLAKEYKILEDGKIYEFQLKDNIFWSDGDPITSEDVIFTIKTIQNSDFKSPLRASWLGVEVEKISETALRFRLEKPSSVFLENCTVKILPEHIWRPISPENFQLSFYNLKPVSSGPYKLEKLSQDEEGKITSLELAPNPEYFGEGPNIKKIKFYFFDEGKEKELKEKEVIDSYSRGEIKGFYIYSFETLIDNNFGLKNYSFSLPRYFALFFNLENSKLFAQIEVREALNYGTDKEEFVKNLLFDFGKIVDSPILPQTYGLERPSFSYQFDLEKAKEILEDAGFVEQEAGPRLKVVKKKGTFQLTSNLTLGSRGDEVTELQKCLSQFPDIYPQGEITGYFGQLTKAAVIKFQEKYKEEILAPYGLTQGTGEVRQSTRAKLNELCFTKEEVLSLSLTLTTAEEPLLLETASLLKSQWEKLGVEVKIETFDLSTLKSEVIKKREYEALLFGEVLASFPDPFPFWHSSQKQDPGLNLSLYSSTKADKLLEEARQSLDPTTRKEKLEEFQELLIKDNPCVFLYNPDFIYLLPPEIKGVKEGIIVDPSKRFSDIENWYIKTKREWK
jgi:ABC-type transport system substrate-binding protein